MSASNPMRFLEKGGVDLELGLEMFFGLVWEAFHPRTLLWNAVEGGGVGAGSMPPSIVAGKVVDSGKSWQHLIFSQDGNPESHTPGTDIIGHTFEIDEGSVTIDDILVAAYEIPIDHVLHSHIDVLGPVAIRAARELATNFDKRGMIMGVKAALTAALTKNGSTMHNGGNLVKRVSTTEALAYPATPTGAKNFRDDVENLAYLMNIDNVPAEERYLLYTAHIARVLQQDTTIFDIRYTRDQMNSLNSAVIAEISGFKVVAPFTNHIPQAAITSASLVSSGTLPSKYQGDFTYDNDGLPVALAFCGAADAPALGYVAAGTEQLRPIHAYMEFDERKNVWFLKAQMMCGWNVINPTSAGMIYVDDA